MPANPSPRQSAGGALGEQGSRGSLLGLSPLSSVDATVLRDNFFIRFTFNAGTEGEGKREAFYPEDRYRRKSQPNLETRKSFDIPDVAPTCHSCLLRKGGCGRQAVEGAGSGRGVALQGGPGKPPGTFVSDFSVQLTSSLSPLPSWCVQAG